MPTYIRPPPHTSPLRSLYLRWRSLRLPWRHRYFIGEDLSGNTFWEFRDRLNASRPRRIVVPYKSGGDWVDYARHVSPQWHQWLRATRLPAPSIEEQSMDVQRQEVLKSNALLADRRWEAKGRLAGPVPSSSPALGARDTIVERVDRERGAERSMEKGTLTQRDPGVLERAVGGAKRDRRDEAVVEAQRSGGRNVTAEKDLWAEADADGKAGEGFVPVGWEPKPR